MDNSTRAWNQVGREMEDFLAGIRSQPVSTDTTVAAVRGIVERAFRFDAAAPLEALIPRVSALLREHAVHVTHPRYFGLFNPSVSLAGIVGDALAAVYNPQLATWSHAPAAQELERITLRHFAVVLGLDADRVSAHFTSGGLEANLSAVIVALAHRFPEVARGGVAAIGCRPVVYVTSESHHSFVKICRVTGLGSDALCEVPTRSDFTMDVEALRGLIARDRQAGRCPLLVVGTAGTTGGGLVDPLASLADVAAASGLWFHVDAAWGGAAMLVPRLRPALAGIERADSITWDAHKWLSVPMGAGMFFCRHPDAGRRAFDVATSYMPAAMDDDTADPYRTTLQWSRRAIGLKVFLSLAERGHDGLARQIAHQAALGDTLRAKLARAGWRIVNETALPLVCMTHDDVRGGRCTTREIVSAVLARGRVWISDVVLGGREAVLRACITSFRTTDEDLDVLVDELEQARHACVRQERSDPGA